MVVGFAFSTEFKNSIGEVGGILPTARLRGQSQKNTFVAQSSQVKLVANFLFSTQNECSKKCCFV